MAQPLQLPFSRSLRCCVRKYAVKVHGKDYKADGVGNLLPYKRHWLELAGLVSDGVPPTQVSFMVSFLITVNTAV